MEKVVLVMSGWRVRVYLLDATPELSRMIEAAKAEIGTGAGGVVIPEWTYDASRPGGGRPEENWAAHAKAWPNFTKLERLLAATLSESEGADQVCSRLVILPDSWDIK